MNLQSPIDYLTGRYPLLAGEVMICAMQVEVDRFRTGYAELRVEFFSKLPKRRLRRHTRFEDLIKIPGATAGRLYQQTAGEGGLDLGNERMRLILLCRRFEFLSLLL